MEGNGYLGGSRQEEGELGVGGGFGEWRGEGAEKLRKSEVKLR